MGLLSLLKSIFGSPVPQPPVNRQSRPPPVPKPAGRDAPPVGRKLNLDASQFAPLTDSQVKVRAAFVGSLWGNPWFGRRDLIPPVTDQRTLLIDRAMVGHGLLTPEQLAEIHDVGTQMDKVRPDLAQAHGGPMRR
jgi:RNA-directed DNA polymerase